MELAKSGGVVLFYGKLPTASVENGRDDGKLDSVLQQLLNTKSFNKYSNNIIEHNFKSGGYAAFIKGSPDLLPEKLMQQIDRDFIGNGGITYVSHRKIGAQDVYLVQNTEDKPIQLDARFRVDGVPELWDAFSGTVEEVSNYERKVGYTHVKLTLEGNVAKLIVFKQGNQKNKTDKLVSGEWKDIEISKDWQFSVIPTRDNIWGDFNWPPSNEKIGPEVRQFKYKEEENTDGTELGWNLPGFHDEDWDTTLFSTGPYWLTLQEIPENTDIIQTVLNEQKELESGDEILIQGKKYIWEQISYSKKIGLGKPSPWGGHSGYPDGHFDKNFIQLKEGRKIMFTRIYSPIQQRVGLNIELRNTEARLWVNGKQEPVLGAVGNLPLNKGYNHVLLDVKDGKGGMLFVQLTPPAVNEMGELAVDLTQPHLSDASWIWVGNTEGAYFRKAFEISKMPETAKVIVSGVSGFRLFVNGRKVDDDIGPWATWDYPKSVDIKPYLKEGKNVFAAWGQFYKGINISYTPDYQGFILAMKAIGKNGDILTLETDKTWKGHVNEFEGWEKPDFNDSEWGYASAKGKADDKPWGAQYLKNLGGSTTPYRPLSVNLTTPYIQVFDEMPDIVYDVKSEKAGRIGWYRFEVPPGTSEMAIQTNNATVWVDGTKVPVNGGVAKVNNPPKNVSTVCVRVEMEQGEYAGAAFMQPIKLKLEGGTIQPGLWTDYALPTYSGIGVYKQKIKLNETDSQQKIELDLGEVLVAAEVLVNGKSIGSKVAAPYKFDLSGRVQPGENEIEIRVANTLAPHYTIPEKAMHLGPVESGLVGPVQLKTAEK
ncbi:hypothetical protein MASR2M47_42310 [Draconibacterium sp.]